MYLAKFLNRYGFALAALLAFHGGAYAGVAAMLLDVKGTASVTVSGRTSTAQIATSLQEDTQVEVGAGGQVSLVHYATREQLTLTGPAKVMVTLRGIEPLSGPQGQSRKLGEGEAKVATNYRGRVVSGALSMRGIGAPVEIIYPGDGETILDGTRAITWEADDAKAPVHVTLLVGDTQVAEQTVTGSSLVPARLAALTSGPIYRVVLTAGDQKPAEAKFTLASPQQRDALLAMKPKDRNSVEAWVMYAMALEGESAVSEAKAAWSEVAKLRPEAAGMVRRMAR